MIQGLRTRCQRSQCTGRLVVEQLRQRDVKVIALVRNAEAVQGIFTEAMISKLLRPASRK